MSSPSLNYMVKRTLYDLALRYGNPISLYRLTSSSTDYETGVKTATTSVIDIHRAPVLPASEMRRFFASIAFLTASKQFTSPGLHGFDQSQRAFIIQISDLPADYEIYPEDWIVYRSRQYEIEMVERLEFDTGWMVVGKELKGTIPQQIINVNASNALDFEEEIADELESA